MLKNTHSTWPHTAKVLTNQNFSLSSIRTFRFTWSCPGQIELLRKTTLKPFIKTKITSFQMISIQNPSNFRIKLIYLEKMSLKRNIPTKIKIKSCCQHFRAIERCLKSFMEFNKKSGINWETCSGISSSWSCSLKTSSSYFPKKYTHQLLTRVCIKRYYKTSRPNLNVWNSKGFSRSKTAANFCKFPHSLKTYGIVQIQEFKSETSSLCIKMKHSNKNKT